MELFLDRFSKNPQISNFMQIRPVGAELFLADTHDEANLFFTVLLTCLKFGFCIAAEISGPLHITFSKVSMHPSTADNPCLSPLLH